MRYIVMVPSVLLIMLLAYFGLQAYTHAKGYEESTKKLVVDKNAKSQAEYRARSLAEKLSLGYFENEKRVFRETIEKERAWHKKRTRASMASAMTALAVILLSSFAAGLKYFTFFGSLSALVVLYLGLFTPILMITIRAEVEYIGEVILSFESKSVLGSVAKLFDSGDAAIAFTILLFSVLVPLTKTFLMMFVAVVAESRFAHGMVKFFKVIGKWSMLDVFVVATLLVYLTGNDSDVSHAEVQAGIYFFLAYVIVSMLTSLSADKMLQKSVA
ncbi:MAG: paraquat-inducible protein A [Sulfurimonas sp.]